MRWRTVHAATALIVVTLGAALLARPQEPAPSAARPVRSVWDGVYAEGQAERGLASYRRSCAKCHALSEDALPRRFMGDAFWTSWGEDSLASLYTTARKSMPADSPGSLSDATYADIIAFLLKSNGMPAGSEELRVDDVRSIRVAQRDSDGDLPAGAFVSLTGCLTKAGKGWTVTRATTPERFRGGDAAVDTARAAAQLAGSAVFELLFVISALDKLAGHQVLVKGLLVRGPADGINVTTVESVASSCTP